MSNPSPIGVFDSGVGGLSILKEIRKLLPNEDLLYFADSAYCPYGGRPPQFIRERSLAIGRFLKARGAKALVVACNTASAAGLDSLRLELQLPVVGVEPAVKPAAALSKNGKVGVLATGVTLASERFNSLLDRFCDGVEVITQPCPGLVEVIEQGRFTDARPLLDRYLIPLLQQGSTSVVLGCTHYPFLRPLVEEMVGPGVSVIDSGEAVARQVARILALSSLDNLRIAAGKEVFYTSGDAAAVGKVIGLLWESPAAEVAGIDLPA